MPASARSGVAESPLLHGFRNFARNDIRKFSIAINQKYGLML
jgi:hypothetical protein